MKPNYDTFRPSGFSTVNPYLFANEPQELIDFLQNAFAAEELNRTINPNTGEIANAILKIGYSRIMISQARGDFENMRTSFYLYVENVDEVFEQALKAGAIEVIKPMDMDYMDRQGGVQDPARNYWWISKRLVESGYEE